MPWWGILIVALGALGIVFGATVLVRRGVWFLNGFIRGLMTELASAPLSETESANPRSLSSMETILLPKVLRDFPEYNREVIAERVKSDAKLYYESGAQGKSLYTTGVSVQFRQSFASALPSAVAGGVIVHRVALHAYDSISLNRVLTFQAAVQYTDPDGAIRQRRLTLKYLAAFTDDPTAEIQPYNCPNCGAPLPIIGKKTCTYCGTALKTPAGLGWLLIEAHEG